MGGKAFQGTTRIKRENVKSTLEHFLKAMLHPCGVYNYKMIGSTGKASLSGDLDIVIPVPEGRSARAFKSYLLMMFQEMLGSDRARSLGQILTVKYPIMARPDEPAGEYVQVDLMLSDDLDGVVWLMSGADDHPVKGCYRALLLALIAQRRSHDESRPGREVKYSLTQPGGLQLRINGEVIMLEDRGREVARSVNPEIILSMLGIEASPDQTETFEDLLAVMLQDDTLRSYLSHYETYIDNRAQRDPINARRSIEVINSYEQANFGRPVKKLDKRSSP